MKSLIARVGTDNAYSSNGKYRWNSPYSRALISLVCGELAKKHLINHGITKKCVVIDCDNVLWGGVLSEDGIDGIKLGEGSRHREFQKFLLTLHYHGVILAICSKNDEQDVLRVFREHSGMLLKEENVACIKANWNNKPDNIKRIAEELNIGLDSIVFVDDEEFEINSVRYILPEVTAILYNRDTLYSELSCFNLESSIDTESVKQRNETYRTDKYRREILESSLSFEKYLKELDTKIDIHKALPTEYSRIAELSQRANRCTNGRRYTLEELVSKIKAGYTLYSVTVEDRFSNLGLVGAIGIEADSLDMFVLSCRAIGRNIEKAMLELIKDEGVRSSFFDDTGKNCELQKILFNLIS